MKILVTGGAGYVGTELVYDLAVRYPDSEIVIYDNLSRGNYNLFIGDRPVNGNVSFIQGDLLDTRRLKEALEGVEIVYHLAAKVTTPFADASVHLFEQVNHWGTAELTYALEETDSVRRFIYLSSASVYGASSEDVDIHSPVQPGTVYGISKKRGEEHVHRFIDKDVDTYIIRCGNVFGYSKSMRFDSVINKFMFEANYHRRITIYGDGEQHRSFVAVDKAADILTTLAEEQLAPGYYNLVDRNLNINEIAVAIREIYPDLEMIYANQHLALRELKVKKDDRIAKLDRMGDRKLNEILTRFRDAFTF